MRYLPGREVAVSSSELANASKIVQQPFTEQDILELHDIFMTNGVHHITVPSVIEGRLIVHALLDSLHYYHDVAALSIEEIPLSSCVHDLSDAMMNATCNGIPIGDYVCDQFYGDFLWIEETPSLVSQLWYAEFEFTLYDLRLDERMPIIIIHYQ